jgi:hypothetical protein
MVSTLHDYEAHPACGDLTWFTNTTKYCKWKDSRSGILWYRTSDDGPDTRKGVAAAIAYYTSSHYYSTLGPYFGVGNKVARALYFQCDREESCDDIGDTHRHIDPSDIIWSLICQCLILDCNTASAVSRRIMELDGSCSTSLYEAMDGLRTQSMPSLFDILFLVLESTETPLLLAIDNVHLLGDSNAATFVDSLRTLVEQRLPAVHKSLRTLVSGSIYGELEELASEIPSITDDTERKGM